LESNTPLATESYLIAAELDGQQRNARIYRAARCDEDMLSKQFAEQIQWTESVEWDARRQLVMAQRQLQLGALTLRSEPLASTDPQKVLSALLEGIRQAGLQCLPWSKSIRRWQTRVCFLGRWVDGGRDWPDVSDSGLMLNLERWLGPYLTGITRLRELGRIDLKAILMDLLPYPQRRLLEDQAPSHLIVPSGSRIPIDYSGDMPVLAVRLQEMFGLRETPAVVGGRQPLLLHLLSPAGRPVQITSDLAGFWQTGYPQVKKELRGRYPKHHWPDDPLKARPTARAKPKR
jgi:ATP-dependent helicase HrpB